MIAFECPSCKTKLQVADQHAGSTIQCPTCKTRATAPTEPGGAPDAIAAAPIQVPMSPPEPPTAVTTPNLAKGTKAERKRPDDDEDGDDDRPRSRRRDEDDSLKPVAKGMGMGAIIFLVLGLVGCCTLGVVGILIALLVPAVGKVREAAARTQSTNNLKQIGFGMHGFNDVNGRLPFNGSDQNLPGFQKYSKVALPNNPMSGSWAFQLLPFVDQQMLFNNVDRNSAVTTYLCPGRERPGVEAGGGVWSDYFYNNYLNARRGVGGPDRPDLPDNPDLRRTFVGITDGTSNTLFAGHGNINTTQYKQNVNVALSSNVFNGGTLGTMRAGGPGQASPPGVTLQRDSAINPGVGSWGGPFPQGGLFLFCDGSVRMINYNTGNLGQFLTPTGGEVAILLD